MFKPVRVAATLIFLVSIVLVFIGAFVINSDVRVSLAVLGGGFLTAPLPRSSCASVRTRTSCLPGKTRWLTPPLVLVIVEYLAYTWYTLSYIPYARSAVLKVFGM